MTETFHVGGIAHDRPFKIQRFGHLGLTIPDIDSALEFWTDNLGLHHSDSLRFPDIPKEVGHFTSVGSDHHSLVFIDAMLEKDDPDFQKGMTVNQLSFQVGTLQEVADGHDYFERLGTGTWRYGRDFPGSNWANYTFDPDGFRVELFYGMEQIGWDRRSKPAQLYTSPPDYEPQPPEVAEFSELIARESADGDIEKGFRPVEEMPYDYVVGGVRLQRPFAVTKMGAVYIFATDVDASVEFYTAHVGLELTEQVEWNGHTASYLRCGTDHHVLAILPMELRKTLGMNPDSYLCTFGIEIGTYSQLRDAVSWLSERGVTVRTDLPPELHPGIGYAAMVTDDSGHTALLYSGMEQIGWDGKPRPAEQRPTLDDEWPDILGPEFAAYSTPGRLGPIG